MSSTSQGNRVPEVVAVLEELGEITAMELAEYLGIDRYIAHAVLYYMNRRTKKGIKRVHIVRYVYDHEGARMYPRAVYALGDQVDAPRPKADPNANKRRYYQRLKKRTLTSSVFNLGMKWRAAA